MSRTKAAELGIFLTLVVVGLLAVLLWPRGSGSEGPEPNPRTGPRTDDDREQLALRERAAAEARAREAAAAEEARRQAAAAAAMGGEAKPPMPADVPAWAVYKGKIETHGNAIVVGLDYLTSRAQSIVVGHVVSTRARPSADGRLILTDCVVKVEKAIKGGPAETVTVTVLGGTLPDGLSLEVSHQPKFQPGDEAVFFVNNDPNRPGNLVGDAQGVLRIDRPGPETRAVRDGFGRPVFGINEGHRFELDDDRGRHPRTSADDLIKHLTGLVQGS